MSWPNGVPPRPRRPSKDESAGTIIGAIAGGMLAKNTIAGALLGGVLGSAFDSEEKLPLQQAVAIAARNNSLHIVSFRRPDLMSASVVFRINDQYFSFLSRVPRNPDLTLEDIEDWLYGDIIEYGFKAAVKSAMAI